MEINFYFCLSLIRPEVMIKKIHPENTAFIKDFSVNVNYLAF